MKILKYLVIVIAVLAIALPSTAKKKKDSDGTPMISFTEKTHDFGIIPSNKNYVTTEFEFVNTGNAPLVIFDAKAECGCTRPSYPSNPIAPGKKGKIKVNFNPRGYMGGFTKSITIKTNGKPKSTVLKITGTVNPNK